MRSTSALAAARLRLVDAMRRFERRLAERAIVDGPLTDDDRRRGRELADERDWVNAVARLRSR